jgi:hypothetical protein
MKTVCVWVLAIASGLPVAWGQSPENVRALLGDWKGDSICTMAESSCHNEKVVWHVARVPDKPGWISIRGDRLDNGKPVSMGTLEFKWEPESQTITCEIPQGIWRLTLSGSRLEGTLIRPDKAVFRRVFLQRAAAPA